MNFRLMDCMKRGLPPDIDVYDAAAWSAPTPLSEKSVAENGAPQKFPDFTRGHWDNRLAQRIRVIARFRENQTALSATEGASMVETVELESPPEAVAVTDVAKTGTWPACVSPRRSPRDGDGADAE